MEDLTFAKTKNKIVCKVCVLVRVYSWIYARKIQFSFLQDFKLLYLQCKVCLDNQQHSHVGIHQSRDDIVLHINTDSYHRAASSQGHTCYYHKLNRSKQEFKKLNIFIYNMHFHVLKFIKIAMRLKQYFANSSIFELSINVCFLIQMDKSFDNNYLFIICQYWNITLFCISFLIYIVYTILPNSHCRIH